jgi:UPF0271 protein
MKIDLNCDLGEGEPLGRTRELMRWITSANVACGGHAGDSTSMRDCVRLTQEFGVNLGAHPGPWSRADKGRGAITLTKDGLESLLVEQVAALQDIAAAEGSTIHHIKLHGALYHAVERKDELADAYVKLVHRQWPGVHIIALSGGQVVGAANKNNVPVWREVFADRAYQSNGRLVPRDQPNAVLTDTRTIVGRVKAVTSTRHLRSLDGEVFHFECDTVCVHSDSPNAVEVVRELSRILEDTTA